MIKTYKTEEEARIVADELTKETSEIYRYVPARYQEEWAVEKQVETKYWSHSKFV